MDISLKITPFSGERMYQFAFLQFFNDDKTMHKYTVHVMYLPNTKSAQHIQALCFLATYSSTCRTYIHLSYIGFVISILTFRFLDSDPLSYIGFVYPFYV